MRFVEEAETHLRGPDADLWVTQLEREHDNVRAGIHRALDMGNSDRALRLAGSMGAFWLRRGYIQEGQSWLYRSLDVGHAEPTQARARALLAVAALTLEAGNAQAARDAATESRATFEAIDDPRGAAYGACMLGAVARQLGATAEARVLAEGALAEFRALDDAAGTAAVLRDLGLLELLAGDLDLARELLEEGLDVIDNVRTTASGGRVLDALRATRSIAAARRPRPVGGTVGRSRTRHEPRHGEHHSRRGDWQSSRCCRRGPGALIAAESGEPSTW